MEEKLNELLDCIKDNSEHLLSKNPSMDSLKTTLFNKGIEIFKGNLTDQNVVDCCVLLLIIRTYLWQTPTN